MPLEHTQLIAKDPGGVIDHADGSVTGAKLADPFTFGETPFTPPEDPTEDYHVVNKTYVDNLPRGRKPVFTATQGTGLRLTQAPPSLNIT
ncbi:hypothetical protein LCGC14_2130260 [marine sediment metagenome]|uniref:Uncharacterized protein n=1 Tax=marine sediment metagenome TaxID=412755 RepID=A0A0F9GEQ1_9ZZZZ